MEWDVDAFGRTIPKLNRIVNPSNRRKMGWEDPNNPGQVLSKDAYNALQRQTQAEYEQERSAWRAGNREWLAKTVTKDIPNLALGIGKDLIGTSDRSKERTEKLRSLLTQTQENPLDYNLTNKQLGKYTGNKGQYFRSQWHFDKAVEEGAYLTTDQEKTQTNKAKDVNPVDDEQRKINEYSGIQNIPTGFKTKAGSKVTRSYTPDQMKEWEEKGGDMTPDDYFSRKHLQDSGKNIEWSTDQKTNEGFTFQQNAKTNDELKPKFGKDGTVTKNLQIASAVLEGIKKLQPQKEAVNINWSNPYDEDNIRGYTGTWA